MIKLIFIVLITVLIIYYAEFIVELYIWIVFEKQNVTLVINGLKIMLEMISILRPIHVSDISSYKAEAKQWSSSIPLNAHKIPQR